MNNLLRLFLDLILFLVLFVFSFYPAGLFLVEKIDKNFRSNEKIILSFASSIVIFVILTLLLGILGLRFLMWPLVIGSGLYSIFRLRTKLFSPWKELFTDKKLILIILTAIVIQGVINWPSGYSFKDGVMFWSSQGNDGLWHVALMEEAKKSMPLVNPVYAGEKLYNYHYLADILMGEFGRVYPVFTSLDLYFRFFPVVISFLMSLAVFSFVARWRESKLAGYWAIFFTSLSGGFGYIATFIKSRQLFAGETIFWAAQGNTIIGNPPHAVAYALLASCLLTLTIFIGSGNRKVLILAFLTGCAVAGFKVSGGFVLAVGVIVAGLFELLYRRKKELFFFSAILGLSNLVVLKLMSKGTLSFLVWEPWWFVRTTITAPGRLEWLDLEHRRQHYVSKHTLKATLRVIQLEMKAFAIFVVGNLGTRFIGVFILFENGFKKIGGFFKDTVNILLLSSMLSGLIVVLLFVQRGIAYNLIQFMQYFILIFGFFSAAFVAATLSKIKSKFLRFFLAGILIAVSIPTVIGNLVEFYGPEKTPLAKVSANELAALNYLKSNTPDNALVLTYPFDSGYRWNYKAQPWPISVWYDTAYVSALSSRRTFLSNEGQVDILGIPFKERHLEVQKYFKEGNASYNNEFIKKNGIGYVYVFKAELEKPLDGKILGLAKFYENDEVIIYKSL